MRRFALALLIVLLLPAAAQAAPDATAPGPYAVERLIYDDGTEIVGGGTSVTYWPQAIRGRLTIPRGAGPFPLVVLLHGRHQTCAVGGALEIIYPVPPCPTVPPAVASVDSYLGYEDLADALATNGYVVASIDANGDNGYDISAQDAGAIARAQTIALNLDRLARWNREDGPAPVGGLLRGKVDFDRIGLMGHSRGGEGVSHFIAYNRERPATGTAAGPSYPGLRAVMALAPIDLMIQKPAGVAWGTVLPLCDGDVYNLAGAGPYERTKDAGEPRVQFSVVGANHNWFNSIWTNDDQAGATDTACSTEGPGTQRMPEADQRRVGVALMAAFLRRYVGPEPAFAPYVTGELGLPPSACPAAGDCDARVQVSHAAGRRRAIALADVLAGATGFKSATVCEGDRVGGSGEPAFTGDCPARPTRSPGPQAALAWDGPAALRIGPGEPDVRGFGALTLRAGAVFGDAANPDGRTQDFEVVLIDQQGSAASVRAAPFAHGALIPAAGTDDRELVLGGIRIGLERFAGVDLGRLAAIELRFAGRGAIQLADVAFQEAPAPAAAAAAAGASAPAPAAASRPGCTALVDLRRAVSRRLVRARVTASGRRVRVDRRLRVRVPAGTRLTVRGRLRGGRSVRRVVVARCSTRRA